MRVSVCVCVLLMKLCLTAAAASEAKAAVAAAAVETSVVSAAKVISRCGRRRQGRGGEGERDSEKMLIFPAQVNFLLS